MFAPLVYFSMSEIADPAMHRAHNEWHQLDHIPENMLLPGIGWSDRWVRSPDCAALSAPGAWGNAHYAIMYWFREPLEETLDDWFVLSERSFQWGRSPQVRWTRRPVRSFFVPLDGYAAPRIGLDAETLPFRPNQGVLVTLSRDRAGTDAAAHARWTSEVRIPRLLDCPGVAGIWRFAAKDLFPTAPGAGSAWSFGDRHTRGADAVPDRMEILFFDEDPLATATAAARIEAELTDRQNADEVMFASPFRAIRPWQWDWFDKP